MPMQPMYFAWFDDYYTRLACVISLFAILGGYFYLRRSRSGVGATTNYASSPTASAAALPHPVDPEVFNSPSGGFSCFLDKELPALDVAPPFGVSVASCRAAAERVPAPAPVPAPVPVDLLDPAEPPAEVWMALNQPSWFLPLLCFETSVEI